MSSAALLQKATACYASPMNATRGRPSRSEKPAEKMLRVRMTGEEWAELSQRSEDAGLSMSEYARARILGKRFPGRRDV